MAAVIWHKANGLIAAEDARAFLRTQTVAHVATVGTGGWPYATQRNRDAAQNAVSTLKDHLREKARHRDRPDRAAPVRKVAPDRWHRASRQRA